MCKGVGDAERVRVLEESSRHNEIIRTVHSIISIRNWTHSKSGWLRQKTIEGSATWNI
jgi:hypothetical protein